MIDQQNIFRTRLVWFLMLIPLWASAQLNANISRNENAKNFISFAGSYGQVFQRDAWFYGFSGEYSWRLNKLPLGIATSIMWDQEKEIPKDKTINTFTGAVTASYLISNRWSVGTGLGKGFMDTENNDNKYKFKNGDWSTALFLGYQIPLNSKSSLGLSASYEYNMSANETSFSLDLAYGFSL